MNTKLQAYATGVLEAVSLLAVALVPVFVNYYSLRVFEPDKSSLLLALAALGALAGLVVLLEARGAGLRAALRQPLVAAALLLGTATLLATLTTTLRPWMVSVLGSDQRAMGLVSLLACLVLFGAVAWLARDAERRGRLVAALILGSVPVVLVALIQATGIQLVEGIVQSQTRVFGTLSNPIFLGTYLMLVVPLTLVRLAAPLPGSGRRIGLGLVLVAQLAAWFLSASRGPQLALAAGLMVMAIAWGVLSGRRWLAWGTVGLAVAGLAFVAVFNLPASPLAPLRDVPVIGRFGTISQTAIGSQATRMNIWRGVDAVLAGDPARLATGHGPESLKYVLVSHGQTSLGGRGEADMLVDRAHNVLLDSLTMTGILGALALLAVYVSWLLAAASGAGLAPRRRDRQLLAMFLGVGLAVGAVAWLVPAWAPLAAATTLLGLFLGLLAYLVVAMVRRPAVEDEASAAVDTPGFAAPRSGTSPAGKPRFDPLAVGLLAIGAAVVVEAAFGIQTVATETVFWALAGLVVAVVRQPLVPEVTENNTAGRADDTQGTITISWSPAAGALGLVAGAMASALAFGFFLRGVATTSDVLALVLAVTVLTILAGAVLAADVGESVSGFVLTAVGVWCAYLLVRWLTFQATGDAALVFSVTLWWFLALALLAGWWLREPAPAALPAVQSIMAGVYLVLAILVSTAVFLFAIRPRQGDIYFQSALANFGQAMTAQDDAAAETARILFDRAVALNPTNDVYYAKWSEMYTRLATSLPGPESLTAFQQAQALIGRAEELDPNMPYHKLNRGHLQLLAVDRMPVEQRAAVANNAALALQEAFDATGGSDPQIANELALARLLAGNIEQALLLLDLSATLDPQRAETFALRGRALEAAGRLEEARQALEQAYQMGLSGPEVLVSLGEIARQDGDLRMALQYYQQAVDQRQVTDWQVVLNLALLYRDLGEFEQALQWLQVAHRLAPADQQAAIQGTLDAMIADRAGIDPSALPGGQLPGNPAPGQPGSPFGGGSPPSP